YTDAEDLEVDIRLTGTHANKIDASINNNRLYIDSTLTENFYTRTSEPYDIRGILVVTDDGGLNGIPSRTMRTKEFPIFVAPVNDPPTRTGEEIPPLYGWEGTSSTLIELDDFDLFHDVDGDQLQLMAVPDLEIEGYDEDAEFEIKWIGKNNSIHLSLNERSDWTGTVPVKLYATDQISFNTNQNPRVEFLVEVRNINDGPVWDPIPMVSIMEDTEEDRIIELTQYARDLDTSRSDIEIMITDYTNKSFVFIQVKKTKDNLVFMSYRPKVENWVGTSSITLELSDGEYTVQATMLLEIIPVNDMPTIRIIEPSENGRIDPGKFSIVGEASDVEG
ncbi:MAG: hypothetical protein U9R75_03565, partial [Candidatus Thermoplasmatota archaeon]|nr:hypothetical protein [Candidatus Thermoplasmatota archaeon]